MSIQKLAVLKVSLYRSEFLKCKSDDEFLAKLFGVRLAFTVSVFLHTILIVIVDFLLSFGKGKGA